MLCHRVNQLLGGQGWLFGEVSEICGVSGVGKTLMCLNSTIALLVEDETSQATWIVTIDNEFSAQRASDIARSYVVNRKASRGLQESKDDQDAIEVSFLNSSSQPPMSKQWRAIWVMV